MTNRIVIQLNLALDRDDVINIIISEYITYGNYEYESRKDIIKKIKRFYLHHYRVVDMIDCHHTDYKNAKELAIMLVDLYFPELK